MVYINSFFPTSELIKPLKKGLKRGFKEGCNKMEKRPKGDFPGGPVAETPSSQCREPEFHPWSENQIPHAATKKKKKKGPSMAHNKKVRLPGDMRLLGSWAPGRRTEAVRIRSM